MEDEIKSQGASEANNNQNSGQENSQNSGSSYGQNAGQDNGSNQQKIKADNATSANNSNQPNNTLSVLSFVCSFVFAPLGLILGIIALAKKQSKGLAISGIVISSIGLFFTFVIFVSALVSNSQTADNNSGSQKVPSTVAENANNESIKPYEYEWYKDKVQTHNILVKNFNNNDKDFKLRIKATITDLQNKTPFGENILIAITDSKTVYEFNRQENPVEYISSAGGQDAYNNEASKHNIALYSQGSYNLQPSKCSDNKELLFYPDANSATHPDQAKYREDVCWSPLKTPESIKLEQEAKMKEEEQKKAEEAKLPAGEKVVSLCSERFEQTYPYKGSKVHSILGVISLDKSSESSRLYKVEVTIQNAYGAERKAIMECNVQKSADGILNIDRFDVY